MLRKIVKVLVYLCLTVLLAYTLAFLLPARTDRSEGLDMLMLVFYSLFSGLFCLQVNIILFTGVFIYGIGKKFPVSVFSRKILILVMLNFDLIFINSYLQLRHMLDGRSFDRVKCENYNLNYDLVSQHTFLSDVYFIYGMGWYRIRYFLDVTFGSGARDEEHFEDYYANIFANCVLSTLLLVIYSICFVYTRRKARAEHLA